MSKYNWKSEKPTEPGNYFAESSYKFIVTLHTDDGFWCDNEKIPKEELILIKRYAKIPSPDDLKKFEAEIRAEEREEVIRYLQALLDERGTEFGSDSGADGFTLGFSQAIDLIKFSYTQTAKNNG